MRAAWSATYGYDGFGNLLSTTPGGTGPSAMNVTVNSATNRVNGWTYDANGNVTAMPSFTGVYDIENRLVEATKNSTILYGYGADNRRIYESRRMQVFSNGDTIQENLTYWSGQRIGSYRIRWNSEAPNNGQPNSFVFAKVEENVYFGSKPLKLGSVIAPETYLTVDRLGSIRRSNRDYFPYGQEAPSTTAGDKEKYATYKHDAATDLSYADQRYYATGSGRFMTADPYVASAGASEPGSWNRYAYVRGEPMGRIDPEGLADFEVTGYCVGCAGTGIPPLGGGLAGLAGHSGGAERANWVWYESNDVLWASYSQFQGATMGPGGGDGRSELDRLLDGWIDEINEAIEKGNISNCQGAVRLFQRALAQPNGTQAVNALAAKITPGSSSYYEAVTSTTNGGGWKPQYKDDFRANGVASQAHHFAGFFAQGYNQTYGSDGALAVVASLLREFSDMRTNQGGRFNWGDFNLGIAGGTLGALAGSGSPLFNSNDLEKLLCGPQ